jgi:sortase A
MPKARTKRTIFRLLVTASVAVTLVGAGWTAYPYYTDAKARQSQKVLSRQLLTAQTAKNYQRKILPVFSPLTRLVIPKIGLDAVVIEGTSLDVLAKGPGHYPASPLPGEPGNVAIAGHRTTYGKPFADLDKLAPGDSAILETPIGAYTYQMVVPFDNHANPFVVNPGDWWVTNPTAQPSLTLTTCTPKGSARHRLIARFQLVGSVKKPNPASSGAAAARPVAPVIQTPRSP